MSTSDEWIRCTDLMPELDPTTRMSEDVLIYLPGSDEILAASLARWDGPAWWVIDGGPRIGTAEVSHWMPFPGPPAD